MPEPSHNVQRSGRMQKISSRLQRHEHNMFAIYQDNVTETWVDEYMHSMISNTQCDVIDSYLVPVFEFIIMQCALKAGLEKVGDVDKQVISSLMTYSLKAGIKKFGKNGEAAVAKELDQFHDLSVFIPVDPTNLSKGKKAVALASLIFLKEEKDGTVKARACADGRKQ